MFFTVLGQSGPGSYTKIGHPVSNIETICCSIMAIDILYRQEIDVWGRIHLKLNFPRRYDHLDPLDAGINIQ